MCPEPFHSSPRWSFSSWPVCLSLLSEHSFLGVLWAGQDGTITSFISGTSTDTAHLESWGMHHIIDPYWINCSLQHLSCCGQLIVRSRTQYLPPVNFTLQYLAQDPKKKKRYQYGHLIHLFIHSFSHSITCVFQFYAFNKCNYSILYMFIQLLFFCKSLKNMSERTEPYHITCNTSLKNDWLLH